MTSVQTARTQGFRASLARRGLSLKIMPDGATLTALLNVLPLEEGEFAVAKEERTTVEIGILRSDIGASVIGTGDTLENTDTGESYRITRVIDQAVDIAVKFHAEKSDPA